VTTKGTDVPDNLTYEVEIEAVGDNKKDAPLPRITKLELDDEGDYEFESITYQSEGTYQYEISQIAGDVEHVIYDDTTYQLTVNVNKTEGSSVSLLSSAISAVDESNPNAKVASLSFENEYVKPTEPETTKAEPETTKAEPTEPETTAPEPTKPEPTKPEPTEPETTAAETSAAETTAAETTKAETTAAETTVAETTTPETTRGGGGGGGGGGSDPTPKGTDPAPTSGPKPTEPVTEPVTEGVPDKPVYPDLPDIPVNPDGTPNIPEGTPIEIYDPGNPSEPVYRGPYSDDINLPPGNYEIVIFDENGVPLAAGIFTIDDEGVARGALAQTGDTSIPFVLLALLMAGAAAGAVVLVIRIRKTND
jgi:pilin isopeptide linkage protein